MRLHRLLAELPVTPPAADPEIAGVQHDSRRIRPGDLYVAIVGRRFDGRSFAHEAAARGAAAVLGPEPAPSGVELPWVAADEPRRLLGPLAVRIYGAPHEALTLVAVTGTNGKSTVAALAASILEAAGRPAGVLGTLGHRFAGRVYGAAERTTPEASDLCRTLAEMRDAGAAAAALEVSSHALDMGRVEGLAFDVAVFTNLSRDHLDYHPDLESYFAAKRRLFDHLKPGGRAVVHVGDPYGQRLAAEIPDALPFGADGAVRVTAAELDLEGIRGRIEGPRGGFDFTSPLLGRYNLENVLAAAAAAEALGLPAEAIVRGIARQPPLPGRMEPVHAGQPFPALVDFAHTPAALEAALTSLRELTSRRIAVVFGCGGDRDPGKRGPMGEIAGRCADLPVVTSDNPRSEDPLAITAAVEAGVKRSGNDAYRMVPDRREAIRGALAVASGAPGEWAVLVAGKGHEEEQIIGDRVTPFSDRGEIEAVLAERAKTQGVGRG